MGLSPEKANATIYTELKWQKDPQPHAPDDSPQVGQDHEAGDEDDDAQHGAGGQDKGLLQGHQPPGEMSPHSD